MPLLRLALSDSDAAVRRLGMIWAAELRLKELRPLVEKAVEAGGPAAAISQDDFALWLAAMDLIGRAAAPTAATAANSNDDLLQKLLADRSTSPGIKAAVIPRLTNFKAPAMIRTLMGSLVRAHLEVRQEAVRSLAFVTVKAVSAPLQKIALNPAGPAGLRMDAIELPWPNVIPPKSCLSCPCWRDADPDIAVEAARALRTHVTDPAVRTPWSRPCESRCLRRR